MVIGVFLWLLMVLMKLVWLLLWIRNLLLLMFEDCGFIMVSVSIIVIVVLVVELFLCRILCLDFVVWGLVEVIILGEGVGI